MAVKSHTTPYHPEGNGLTERFNRTLLGMLGTLVDEKKNRWADYLSEMLHAYNNTIHSSTGYTPSYLMFGRHARVPVDVMMGGPLDERNTVEKWVKRHHERLYYAYKRAGELNAGAGQHQKRQHDNQGLLGPLMIGERVLVCNVGPKGQGKLANFWHNIPYVVVKQPNPDIPVYVVTPEKGEGKERVLHRKLLRPCPLVLQAPAQEGEAAAESEEPGPSTSGMFPPTRWLTPWSTWATTPTGPPQLQPPTGPPQLQPPTGPPQPSITTPSGEDPVIPELREPRTSHRTTKGIPPQRYS